MTTAPPSTSSADDPVDACLVSPTPTTTIVDNSNDDDDDEEQPLVLNSLADMMAMAGTLPEQEGAHQGNAASGTGGAASGAASATTMTASMMQAASMIEAELNFSCMDPEEYQQEQEDIFLGKESIFGEDGDDDENTEPHSSDDDEEDDDDGIFAVLGLGGGDDDDDEVVEPAPPPRAFLHLWTAMAQWVTPDAVAFVRGMLQQQQQPLQPDPTKFPRQQQQLASPFDRSDVGASRCAGLMAALHLHTARCWSSSGLGFGAEELRAAETALADLVRCFDYSQPTPRLDICQTRALTCVLLDIVAQQQQQKWQQQQQREENFVPTPCQALGMTPEEYRYLVRSAILNFEAPASTYAAAPALLDHQ